MQGIGQVEKELRRLGGVDLLADALIEAQTYADLYFPWDGDGAEPRPRHAARLRVLTARLEAALADEESRADPDRPDPAELAVRGPVAGLAARIAVSAQSCPLIAGLHSGRLDTIATDTDDGRLVGVRVDGDSVVVGVVARDRADPDRIIEQVRAAVGTCAPAAHVSVSVAARHDARTDTVVDDESA